MSVGTPSAARPEPPTRGEPIAVTLVVAIVISVVVATVAVAGNEPNPADHMVCVGENRLGNVSAWYPYALVASPYAGFELGELRYWSNYTVGGVYHNYTTNEPTNVSSGDVWLGGATGGNWTIYSAANETVVGSGTSNPCASDMIALLGPPNGVVSEVWAGPVASGLETDSGLPTSFNASERCAAIDESSNCAVSSIFDLNFAKSEGRVDTCGKAGPTTLAITGRQLLVDVPFPLNGTAHSVPVGPSPESGLIGWFNYTFPANGGIWQYQALPGVSGSDSGLVFSYSGCPA
jgi:hypothetical protein